jgi:excisionase family DNA binding protein
MASKSMTENPQSSADGPTDSSRISVIEIARRLHVGRLAVYSMLERRIIPGIRLGRRWIITRHAYLDWERTCGRDAGPGLEGKPEVDVVN